MVGITELPRKLLLLQLRVQHRATAAGRTEFSLDSVVDSRIIDAESGREVGRQFDLPQVLDADDGVLLVTGDEPEPWLVRVKSVIQGRTERRN